jgi:hypothetical protein
MGDLAVDNILAVLAGEPALTALPVSARSTEPGESAPSQRAEVG